MMMFALVLLLFSASLLVAPHDGDFSGCPARGQGGDPILNRLKNRADQVNNPEIITIAQIIDFPVSHTLVRRPRLAWPKSLAQGVSILEEKGVRVEAYLLGVKQEGPESPNCHRPTLRDLHLWIGESFDQTRAHSLVVELTPRWSAVHLTWNLKTLTQLAQQRARIRITGWLLLDQEHPEQQGKTRGSLWEIHPITHIEVWSADQWRPL